MCESTDINRCILLVSQPSTESNQEDMEIEEKSQIGTTMHKSNSYLLNVEDNGQSEKHHKIGRSSSVTSKLSINSQSIDPQGTLKAHCSNLNSFISIKNHAKIYEFS